MGPDPRLAAGDYVVITIEDDGQGIQPDDVPRIFDPFFTTKGPETGTGLGLANSYSIVEQHGGTITVDSEPGEGSCFSIYLPLSTDDANETTGPGESDETRQRRLPRRGEMVLIADDNAELRDLASRVLESAGYETCVAADGREALELFRANREKIHLLILDLVMPEMGGQEVAETVRRLSDDVRILIVSGYVPEETKRSLNEPVLRKPYTIDELMQALEDLD